MLAHMDYALQPHLYKNVPVYLWPWVWWQLFQIERWIKLTGRMVLGGVARDGKVYVLHVADDPNEIKPWSPEDLRPLKGRHQDWIASISNSPPRVSPQNDQSCPHGERSRTIGRGACMVRLRSPCGTYNPTRHGDQLALAMRLLEWPLMSTRVGCNEPLRIAPPPLAQPPPNTTQLKTPTTTHHHDTGRSQAHRPFVLRILQHRFGEPLASFARLRVERGSQFQGPRLHSAFQRAAGMRC